MRVLTVGGGPAGLYASLLLKRSDPDIHVTVLERNPPGATYGWGVVFSDRTLSAFREADTPTYDAITERFVLWDAIDVHVGDDLVRSGGHVFAGLARVELLRILQERCRELGVELRFEVEVEDLQRAGEYDLVLAADGINSIVRLAREDVFGTTTTSGASRYIWFGTTRVLDSFTFAFRDTEHGLFQAHAYPFDANTSTWIVECSEPTWRRAGLDTAGESDSIRFCEKVFERELSGHPLLSNRSQWVSFQTVRNRTWRDGNVVLIGDAAHTAHFSIGSGTKLAMEDAISLARAVARRPEDLDAAIGEYEAERHPLVERFQEAADESRRYFERTSRYRHLEPEQLAFHLLTRSGRIDYDELRRRDPLYADGVDRWFSGAAERRRRAVAPPPIFTPMTIRSLELPNRIVGAVPLPVARDGRIDGSTADVTSGVDGSSLLMTGIAAVSAEGRITLEDAGLYDDGHVSRWRDLVDAAHARDTLAAVAIGHAGRRGATRPRHEGLDRPLRSGAWDLLAPSSIRYARRSRTPREMDDGDVARVTDAFVAATRRAADAGADFLLVHMAHGYLLASFLSPLTNRREDGYGGDRVGRMRLPLEVFAAVRAAWPDERPLGAILAASDWARGGWRIGDAIALARELRARGCDLAVPLAGQTVPAGRPRYGPAFLAPYADAIRNEARVPTLLGGQITTTGTANTIVAAGRADLVLLDPLR